MKFTHEDINSVLRHLLAQIDELTVTILSQMEDEASKISPEQPLSDTEVNRIRRRLNLLAARKERLNRITSILHHVLETVINSSSDLQRIGPAVTAAFDAVESILDLIPTESRLYARYLPVMRMIKAFLALSPSET